MVDSLDASLYVHCPQLDVAGSLSLGKALLAATPKGASAGVKKTAHAVHAALGALEKAFEASNVSTPLEDMRPIDHTLDVCWGAVRDRLDAFNALPPDSKSRTTAIAIAGELFPDGTTFLKANYPSEHAESAKRLAVVKKHEKDLDALVGDEFISALRDAHAAYGKALGIAHAKEATPTAPTLREPLDAFRAAVGKYAVQLLAFGDDEHAAAARSALAPIDQFRALAGRRRSDRAALPPAAPSPTSPTPPPPT